MNRMQSPIRWTVAAMLLVGFGLLFGSTAWSDRPLITPPDDPRLVLLTDFADQLPDPGMSDVDISFRLADIRRLPSGGAGSVMVQLQRRGGEWAAQGHRAAADYNERSPNEVTIGELTFDGTRLQGTLRVQINADAPRPGSSPNANPRPFPAGPWDSQARRHRPDPDIFELTINAVMDRQRSLPNQPDRNAFRAPWRKDIFTFGGLILEGTYSAEFRGNTVEGSLLGAVAPAPVTGRWGTRGNMHITPAEEGGLSLLARLPGYRVAADYGSHAWFNFADPQDWSDYGSIRIHAVAPVTRNDATVEMVIQRGNHGSFVNNNVARLRDQEMIFQVSLEKFGRGMPDRTGITAIALGVSNPHGVGDVAVTIRRIELVRHENQLVDAMPAVKVTVDPYLIRKFEDADTIPKGLFGHHDVGENNPRQPREGEPDALEFMRQINPGFLRPLTHTGFTGNPGRPGAQFVERARAANALDNVVWCHTVDLFARPEWMDQGADPWAERLRTFYARIGEIAWRPGEDDNVLRRLEVWNEPFFWGRHINTGPFTPAGSRPLEDPTQYGYLPARLGAEVYAQFFNAAAEGARSTNPHVLLGGPSAPAFTSHDFGFLKDHMSIFFEESIDNIDFLTEHHYGGLPESFAAGFEVVTGWLDIKHGRRIPIYNTEANLLHAPAAATSDYNVRDILECILVNPDVNVGRALHALWNGFLRNQGEIHAYTWLATLRGKMLMAESDDQGIAVVASHPREGELVMVVYNRSMHERTVELPKFDGFDLKEALWLAAEAPRRIQEQRDTEGMVVAPQPAEGTQLVDMTEALAEELKAATPKISLPVRHGVRLTFTQPGYQPSRTQRNTRHFSDILLATVRPGENVKGLVQWRGVSDPRQAKAAYLRLVTRDVHSQEGQVLINDRLVRIPASTANSGDAVVQRIPIPVGWLSRVTTLEFEVLQPEYFNGYRVWTAAIELEH